MAAISWCWLAIVAGFKTYIAIGRAYMFSHLDEWGDPPGGLWTPVVAVIYVLFILPAMTVTTITANALDLYRYRRMHHRDQLIHVLVIVAAIIVPIVTFVYR